MAILGFDQASEKTTIRVLNDGFRQIGAHERCLPMHVGDLKTLTKRIDRAMSARLSRVRILAANSSNRPTKPSARRKPSGYADLLLKQKEGWEAVPRKRHPGASYLMRPKRSSGKPLRKISLSIAATCW